MTKQTRTKNTFIGSPSVAICFIGLVVLFLYSPATLAGLLRAQADTLVSARNGEDYKTEIPLYEFLESTYVSDNDRYQLSTNFSFFDEPLHSKNAFNLYILDLNYNVIPNRLRIKMGRSFNYRTSLRSTSSDSIGADVYLFDKEITVGVDGGLERREANTSFDSTDATAKVLGAHFDYRASSLFPTFVGAKYYFRQPTDRSASNQNIVGLSTRKFLSGSLSPELMANSEFDVSNTLPDSINFAEVGMDLYPTYRSAIRARGVSYKTIEKNKEMFPIFSIFSLGRLYEGSIQGDYQFNELTSMSLALAYDDYLLQQGLRTHGYRADLELSLTPRVVHFTNGIYFFRSYGGSVYGDRVSLLKDLSDRINIEQVADFTYYEKITSSKRMAINLESRLGVWLLDRLHIAGGFEFNSNNIHIYDIRAVSKLTYLLWTEL